MKHVKELREEKGLSQQQLADMLDIHRTAVAKYESGANDAKAEILEKLADIFNVSADYLLGRTDEKSPTPKGAELSEEDMALVRMLTDLSPSEFAKAAAYIQGLRDNRGASDAPAE